jgi:hypothetical protein
MDTEIQDLIINMEKNEGATQFEIEKLLSLRIQFPDDYIKFMQYSNGAEGSIGEEGYLSISPIEEVFSINKKLKSSDLASKLLLFASDGAGIWYAFRKGISNTIVEVDLFDLSLDSIIFRASNFKEFLKFAASLKLDN